MLASSVLAVGLLAGWNPFAAPPAWLVAASHEALPATTAPAVVLLDERATVVSPDGELRTHIRRAVRILRAGGSEHAQVSVGFGGAIRLRQLAGWHIAADGRITQFGTRDAFEVGVDDTGTYTDARMKTLVIPQTEPGSVVGFEWETGRREQFPDDVWSIQPGVLPIRRTRYTLTLLPGWTASRTWLHREPIAPLTDGLSTVWEVENVEAAADDSYAASVRGAGPQLGIVLGSRDHGAATWPGIGGWFARISQGRRTPTPEIEAKVRSLTGAAPEAAVKIGLLTRFLQQEIRYVGIELGAGSYQPRAASDIFSRRFGDCKDKVTLLSSMLHAAGIESNYVLIHSERGATVPEFPSLGAFNHVVLAVPLREPPAALRAAVVEHSSLGPLLIFDPTDEMTPLGEIPARLANSVGLLVTSSSGELISLPQVAASDNERVLRATLSLAADGAATGQVELTARGAEARALRARLAAVAEGRWPELTASLLDPAIDAGISELEVSNATEASKPLAIHFQITARRLARPTGTLLVLADGVAARPSPSLEKRVAPLAFPFPFTETEELDIALPDGFTVDEEPADVALVSTAGSWSRNTTHTRDHLRTHTSRIIRSNAVDVPEAKRLFRDDSAIVLRR